MVKVGKEAQIKPNKGAIVLLDLDLGKLADEMISRMGYTKKFGPDGHNGLTGWTDTLVDILEHQIWLETLLRTEIESKLWAEK